MTLVEANRLASFGLVVLIWLVQLIIYPAFADIEPGRFAAWHAGYTRAVTWVVGPLMLAQAGLMAWQVVKRPGPGVFLAAGLIAVAWVATFALAVPAHERLQAAGPDPGVIRGLVRANWLRTVAWTAAFLLLLLA